MTMWNDDWDEDVWWDDPQDNDDVWFDDADEIVYWDGTWDNDWVEPGLRNMP